MYPSGNQDVPQIPAFRGKCEHVRGWPEDTSKLAICVSVHRGAERAPWPSCDREGGLSRRGGWRKETLTLSPGVLGWERREQEERQALEPAKDPLSGPGHNLFWARRLGKVQA